MRTHSLSLRCIAIVALQFLCISAFAQNTPTTPKPKIRYPILTSEAKRQIDSIRTLKGGNQVVTDSILDKKLDSTLNQVSGVTYKDGRAAFTSATIDDKSLTLNLTVLDKRNHTLQVTLKGEAEEKVVSLLSKGKYGKTLSGGLTYNYFPTVLNWVNFLDKDKLHTRINRVANYYDNMVKSKYLETEIKELVDLSRTYGRYAHPDSPFNVIPKDFVNYEKSAKRLGVLTKQFKNYLPEDFESMSYSQQDSTMDELSNAIAKVDSNYHYKLALDSVNQLQLSAKVSSVNLFWFTTSVLLNNEKYPLFDANAKEDDYLKSKYDNHISFDVSANFLHKFRNVNLWVFPTVKYKNALSYSDSTKTTVNIAKGTEMLSGSPLTKYKAINYYPNEAPRAELWTFELPVVIYFPKLNFGFDLAINTNRITTGGRFGVYVPLGGAEEKVIIEPLVTFKDLDKDGKVFFKEQVAVGLSLTFAVPSFVTGKKKK